MCSNTHFENFKINSDSLLAKLLALRGIDGVIICLTRSSFILVFFSLSLTPTMLRTFILTRRDALSWWRCLRPWYSLRWLLNEPEKRKLINCRLLSDLIELWVLPEILVRDLLSFSMALPYCLRGWWQNHSTILSQNYAAARITSERTMYLYARWVSS